MKSYFGSHLNTGSDDQEISSPHIDGRRCMNHRNAMGDTCELQFLANDALIWTRFLPTESQWRDATVLLTFGGGHSLQRAGDDGDLWLKFDIGEGCVWWGSGFGNLPSSDNRPPLARGWVGKLQSGLWWCGNDEGWRLGFGGQKLKIRQWGSTIYRVLGTES
jgi:hypothetical protein